MAMMVRKQVYLKKRQATLLKLQARQRGISEAELIREALRTLTSKAAPPRPRLPLFTSGKPRLAERIDEALLKFGES